MNATRKSQPETLTEEENRLVHLLITYTGTENRFGKWVKSKFKFRDSETNHDAFIGGLAEKLGVRGSYKLTGIACQAIARQLVAP